MSASLDELKAALAAQGTLISGLKATVDKLHGDIVALVEKAGAGEDLSEVLALVQSQTAALQGALDQAAATEALAPDAEAPAAPEAPAEAPAEPAAPEEEEMVEMTFEVEDDEKEDS